MWSLANDVNGVSPKEENRIKIIAISKWFLKPWFNPETIEINYLKQKTPTENSFKIHVSFNILLLNKITYSDNVIAKRRVYKKPYECCLK